MGHVRRECGDAGGDVEEKLAFWRTRVPCCQQGHSKSQGLEMGNPLVCSNNRMPAGVFSAESTGKMKGVVSNYRQKGKAAGSAVKQTGQLIS